MRAALLVFAVLALATTQDQPQDEHSRCETRCAAVPKDTHTHKACACGASKGETCDLNGKRTTETMTNCKNATHCKRLCCDCCPKD